jgi:protein phosphatase
VIYSRTGRPFLSRPADSAEALGRVRAACDASGLWDALSTQWVLLDCELMPWSAKAIDLIRRQYAAVGAAAKAGLGASIDALEQAQSRGLDVAELLDSQRHRTEHVDDYVDAYRRYVWPVQSVADLRLAPFHILAAETGPLMPEEGLEPPTRGL